MSNPTPRDIAAIKADLKSLNVAVRTLISRSQAGGGNGYDNLTNEEIADEVDRLCDEITESVGLHTWPDNR